MPLLGALASDLGSSSGVGYYVKKTNICLRLGMSEKEQAMMIIDSLMEDVEGVIGADGSDLKADWEHERDGVEMRLSALIDKKPPGQVVAHLRDNIRDYGDVGAEDRLSSIMMELDFLEDPELWARP